MSELVAVIPPPGYFAADLSNNSRQALIYAFQKLGLARGIERQRWAARSLKLAKAVAKTDPGLALPAVMQAAKKATGKLKAHAVKTIYSLTDDLRIGSADKVQARSCAELYSVASENPISPQRSATAKKVSFPSARPR